MRPSSLHPWSCTRVHALCTAVCSPSERASFPFFALDAHRVGGCCGRCTDTQHTTMVRDTAGTRGTEKGSVQATDGWAQWGPSRSESLNSFLDALSPLDAFHDALSLLTVQSTLDPLQTMLAGSSMHLVSGSPSDLVVRPILLWFEAGPSATSKLGSIFYSYSVDTEGSTQQRSKREGQSMALERLQDVFLGAQQPLFRCAAALAHHFDSARCFSLVSKALSMHLVADTADDRNAWLRGIKERFVTRKANRATEGNTAAATAAAAGAAAGAGAAVAAAAAVPAKLHPPPSLSVLKPLMIAGQVMHRLSLRAGGGEGSGSGPELLIKPVLVWWQPCDATSDVSQSSRGRVLGELCWVEYPVVGSVSPTALKQKVPGQSLPLHRISDVFLGSQRPIFRSVAASFASDRCFTLDAASASASRGNGNGSGGGSGSGGGGGGSAGVNLVAASHAEREVWVQGIKAIFAEVKRERNAAKEQSAAAAHAAAAASAAASAAAAMPATGNPAAASSPASSPAPASAPGGPAVNDDASAASAASSVDLQSIALDVPASASSAATAAASVPASPAPLNPAATASASAAAAADPANPPASQAQQAPQCAEQTAATPIATVTVAATPAVSPAETASPAAAAAASATATGPAVVVTEGRTGDAAGGGSGGGGGASSTTSSSGSDGSDAIDSSQPGRAPAEKPAQQQEQPQPQLREIPGQAPRQKRKKTLWQKLTCAGDYEDQ